MEATEVSAWSAAEFKERRRRTIRDNSSLSDAEIGR